MIINFRFGNFFDNFSIDNLNKLYEIFLDVEIFFENSFNFFLFFEYLKCIAIYCFGNLYFKKLSKLFLFIKNFFFENFFFHF